MAVRVSKEFRWEMGHRLPYHETCKNIHGHSYRMVVEVDGEVNEQGMVVDFGDISAAVKPLIDKMDHAFMLDPWDAEMRLFLETQGLKTIEMPFYSTAENIAAWVAQESGSALLKAANVTAVTIQVFETASSVATVRVP